jgi:hypothetical protein
MVSNIDELIIKNGEQCVSYMNYHIRRYKLYKFLDTFINIFVALLSAGVGTDIFIFYFVEPGPLSWKDIINGLLMYFLTAIAAVREIIKLSTRSTDNKGASHTYRVLAHKIQNEIADTENRKDSKIFLLEITEEMEKITETSKQISDMGWEFLNIYGSKAREKRLKISDIRKITVEATTQIETDPIDVPNTVQVDKKREYEYNRFMSKC